MPDYLNFDYLYGFTSPEFTAIVCVLTNDPVNTQLISYNYASLLKFPILFLSLLLRDEHKTVQIIKELI